MMSSFWLVFLPLWVFLWPDVTCANDLPFLIQANFVTLTTALLLSTTPELFNIDLGFSVKKECPPAIPRVRKSVHQIFTEFGPT